MSVLWISHVTVTDQERYGQHVTRATEAIGAHGGGVSAKGADSRRIDGTARPRKLVARVVDIDAVVAGSGADRRSTVEHVPGACERERVIFAELVP